MAQTHYQVLGLTMNASADEIRLAYRNMAKVYHPDRVSGNKAFNEEKFKQINEAYQVLSDPQKKAIYDLTLISYPRYRPRNVKYRKRTRRYYSSRPSSYSRKAYIYAFFFVLGLISIVGYSTFYLVNYQSQRAYEQGVYFYNEGQYAYAIVKLMNATKDYGSSSVKASILASKILLHEMQNYEEALLFIEKGLKRAENLDDKAQLYYYKATCFKFQKYYDQAYMAYQTTVEIDPEFDSAYYQMGELDAFVFDRYQQAVGHFNKLLSVNADQYEGYLGRGYCQQKLGNHEEAIKDFAAFLEENTTEGMAFYLKAVSELAILDTINACNDLSYARILGVEKSKELIELNCPIFDQ